MIKLYIPGNLRTLRHVFDACASANTVHDRPPKIFVGDLQAMYHPSQPYFYNEDEDEPKITKSTTRGNFINNMKRSSQFTCTSSSYGASACSSTTTEICPTVPVIATVYFV